MGAMLLPDEDRAKAREGAQRCLEATENLISKSDVDPGKISMPDPFEMAKKQEEGGEDSVE